MFDTRVLFHAVFLAELVNPTGGIKQLLFTSVERVALGADFNGQIMGRGRARLERATATASHVDFFVSRMDVSFHVRYLQLSRVATPACPGTTRFSGAAILRNYLVWSK
jgi:hypothetical protein